MTTILLVLSGSDHWTLTDGTRHPTGYWAEEFVVPHRTFRERGVDVRVATPGGVRPTVDQGSLHPTMAGGEERATELRDYIASVGDELDRPVSLEDAATEADRYDAVYVPGGHGPMEDLVTNQALASILTAMYDSGRVVAAMCHGPAGLLSANRPDGSWLFAGRRLTGFTDEEERQAGLADRAPWLLEDRLRERGGQFASGQPWQPFVIMDGNLITGQNPASSQAATDRTLQALKVSHG